MTYCLIVDYYTLKRIIELYLEYITKHNKSYVRVVGIVVMVMVFNATFNNISAILWRSVLLVEKTEVPRENHRPVANH